MFAECHVEMLLEEEIEIGFNDLITLDEDQEDREFTEADKAQFQGWKKLFVDHVQQGVKFAMGSYQTWLIFNGTMHFWNNYLPIFKRMNFYEIINEDALPCMAECFEGMNNTFITANFGSDNIDYDLHTKLSLFTNFSIIYCRILEHRENKDEALRICDLLL